MAACRRSLATNTKICTARDRQNNGDLDFYRPRENIFASKYDQDPFPNPHVLDLDSESGPSAIQEGITNMLQNARENAFPEES